MTPAPIIAPILAAEERTSRATTTATWNRMRRRRWIIALAGLWLIAAAVAALLLLARFDPVTPLGYGAAVGGGQIKVSAVLPLDLDGWVPPTTDGAPLASAPAGSHRIRVLIVATAGGPTGLKFSATDYSVQGIGAGPISAVWASPRLKTLTEAQTTTATLVFDIPNTAVAVELTGPGGIRLSLGEGHHGSIR